MEKPKKEHDGFFRLKYVGYCQSQLPAEGGTFEDLVRMAKFKLCEARGYLLKDSIWDKYTDEEVLAEYYGHLFTRDSESRKAFENEMNGEGDTDAAADWFEDEIKKNQAALDALKAKQRELEGNQDEEFEFSPPVGK